MLSRGLLASARSPEHPTLGYPVETNRVQLLAIRILHPYRQDRLNGFDYSSPMLRYQTLIGRKAGQYTLNFDRIINSLRRFS
jgi:hypothetical protein